jgi:hypothetical protein
VQGCQTRHGVVFADRESLGQRFYRPGARYIGNFNTSYIIINLAREAGMSDTGNSMITEPTAAPSNRQIIHTGLRPETTLTGAWLLPASAPIITATPAEYKQQHDKDND